MQVPGDKLITAEVTEEEYRLILIERANKAIRVAHLLKQKTCEHDYQFSGHGHNDSCYTCSKCGHNDWR